MDRLKDTTYGIPRSVPHYILNCKGLSHLCQNSLEMSPGLGFSSQLLRGRTEGARWATGVAPKRYALRFAFFTDTGNGHGHDRNACA